MKPVIIRAFVQEPKPGVRPSGARGWIDIKSAPDATPQMFEALRVEFGALLFQVALVPDGTPDPTPAPVDGVVT